MKFLMLVCVEEDRFENDEAAGEAASAGDLSIGVSSRRHRVRSRLPTSAAGSA